MTKFMRYDGTNIETKRIFLYNNHFRDVIGHSQKIRNSRRRVAINEQAIPRLYKKDPNR
ncbi:hypothetical protein JCM16161A_13700 [Vulcanisaeta sp. JCM 16161]